MANDSSERPAKRRGIVFKLLMALVVLVVLLVAAFFVVTSSAFFKGVILPKVGASMNSDITVSSASVGLSEVVLNNLKLVPHGRDQLLQAQTVRTRFSLSDIIGGNIVVHELTLQSPNITIVKNADGTSNLDPLTQQKKTTTIEENKPAPTAETKTKKETKIDVTNVSIKNAQLKMTEKLKSGGQKVTEVSNFDFSVDRLQNGAAGKLQLSGNARLDQPAATGTEAGTLAAKLSASFDYKLANDLSPQSATGTAQAQITSATGSMAELNSAAVNLNCNLTPTEIQNLALQFQRGGNTLGELRVNGPFSVEKKEGRFNVSLLGLDRDVLNLVGASQGIDFNKTRINSTNVVDVRQGGNTIAVDGNFEAAQFSITKKADKQTTPPLDLRVGYQVTVDQNKQSALLQKLQINGIQNGNDILTGTLSKPMPVSWGQGGGVPEEAAFNLKINNLNLADWKSLAGDLSPSGLETLNLDIVSKNAGKQLTLDLSSHLANFSAKFGSNQIANADIQLNAKGQIDEFKKVTLTEYQVKLAEQNSSAVTLNGSGTVDTSSKAVDLKTTLQANIPQLLHTVSVPGVTVNSGDVRFDGHIVQSGNAQSVTGQLALQNFTGALDKTKLDQFAAEMNADLTMTGSDVNIKKLQGSVTQAGQPAGSFDVSGTWNLSNKVGQIKAALANFNQRALGPFLAPSLNGKQLVSVKLDGTASANLQSANSGSVNADLTVTNLIVRDPAHPSTNAPLSAHLAIDGAMQNNVLNLKQARVALSPTQRAKNELELTGTVDMSKSNNITANLTAKSDALDVTEFYDIYSSKSSEKQPNAIPAQQPTPSATATATNPNTEPDPIHLPISQANIDVNIAHFYLHDLDAALKSNLKIDNGSHVVLNPFQLLINNAPITANVDLNLGVRGYAYNLSFTMDHVAVGPLADTFSPESKGAYRGDLVGKANFSGQGTTGKSLHDNLVGQANIVLTNANVKLNLSKRMKGILSVVALVLQVPEINQSPLTLMRINIGAGNGQLQLTNVFVQGAAYQATVQGAIPIADVLTNSPLNLPVDMALANNLAQRSHLGTTNANSAYAPLPRFLTIEGTLGQPKEKINKVALAATSLGAIGGFIPGKGGAEASKFGSALGGFLGGQQQQQQQQPQGATTNPPPATNTTPNAASQLLKGLGGFLNKKK